MNEEKKEIKEKEIINKMNEYKKYLKANGQSLQGRTRRIPIEDDHVLEKIGNGNWKKGLKKLIISYHTNDPIALLMKDCDMLMDHLKLFFNDNHYQHFDNFPAFFRRFLETGYIDVRYLIKQDDKKQDEKK